MCIVAFFSDLTIKYYYSRIVYYYYHVILIFGGMGGFFSRFVTIPATRRQRCNRIRDRRL